jgi:transmembrane sensor
MMNNTERHTVNEKIIDFVAHCYRHGAMNLNEAYRQTLAKAGIEPQVRPIRRGLVGLVAASFALLVVAGTWLYFNNRSTTLVADNTSHIVRLADGTRVTLAPHSTLSYHGNDCREVEVSGKVFLEVVHNARHPFTVTDNAYTIRDIGTKLMVDETAQGTTVLVTEGAVSFSANTSHQAVVLRQNESARLAANGTAPKQLQLSPNAATWATHIFHFNDTPLSEVLRDLSAYYHVRLTCEDGSDKHLTGDFHTDSLDTILSIINETLEVKIEKMK